MPSNDLAATVATNTEAIRNIGFVLVRVENYMAKTSEENSRIIRTVERMEANQERFEEYRKKCETERKEMQDDIEAMKLSNSRQAGRASVIAALSGTVTAAAIAIGSALMGTFHK